jgi:hypothetical protein
LFAGKTARAPRLAVRESATIAAAFFDTRPRWDAAEVWPDGCKIR